VERKNSSKTLLMVVIITIGFITVDNFFTKAIIALVFCVMLDSLCDMYKKIRFKDEE
jgi:predicted PurR-regulated permease PerM